MEPPRALTAREIARLVDGELVGPADIQLAGVAPLDRARPGDISLLVSSRYLQHFQRTSAGAVLLDRAHRDLTGGPATRIVVDDPRTAVQRLLFQMYPTQSPRWGVHPRAQVGKRVRWSGRLALGPLAILEAGVTLGHDCVIGPGAVVGERSHLGDRCRIESAATLAPETVLGDDVLIRTGARIGGVGFGYLSAAGQAHRRTHMGRCILADGVEIGANTTIDRGSIGDTLVGAGTKIDNLVHIGHNVRIGQGCYIMAQVGVAGSTDVGDDVTLAGQAGLADHLSVGSSSRVAAQSGVIGDIPPGSTVSGYPARPHREVLRQVAALKRLTPLVGRLEQLALEPLHER